MRLEVGTRLRGETGFGERVSGGTRARAFRRPFTSTIRVRDLRRSVGRRRGGLEK